MVLKVLRTGLSDFFESVSGDNRVVIEAVGTPGTGKSHVCDWLIKKNIEPRIEAYHSIDGYPRLKLARTLLKARMIFYILATDISIVIAVSRVLYCFSGLAARQILRNWANMLLIACVTKRGMKKKHSTLFDQGLIQAIWSLYYHGKGIKNHIGINELSENMVSLFGRLGISRLMVIHLMASPSLISERLQRRRVRGSSPMNQLTEERLEQGLAADRAVRNLLINLEHSKMQITVLRIKNESPFNYL